MILGSSFPSQSQFHVLISCCKVKFLFSLWYATAKACAVWFLVFVLNSLGVSPPSLTRVVSQQSAQRLYSNSSSCQGFHLLPPKPCVGVEKLIQRPNKFTSLSRLLIFARFSSVFHMHMQFSSQPESELYQPFYGSLASKISSLNFYLLYHLPKTKFTTSGQQKFTVGTWEQRNTLGKKPKSSLFFLTMQQEFFMNKYSLSSCLPLGAFQCSEEIDF